jgi:hypothetical protein
VPDNDDEEDVPAGTGEAIAYWQRRQPGIDIDTLAVRVGRSTRQVRRHLNNASKATGDRPVNGRARPALADSLRTE